MSKKHNNVIVLGTGNAALCAAISAAENGADVTVIDKTPEKLMGGNSRLTSAALRLAFETPAEIRAILDNPLSDDEWKNIEIKPYPQKDYMDEVIRAGHGRPHPEFVEWFTSQSKDLIHWLRLRGIKFELARYGTAADLTANDSKNQKKQYLGGLVIQAVGGGEGLVFAEYKHAKRLGCKFIFNMVGSDIHFNKHGAVKGVITRDNKGQQHYFEGAVVLGCGGFEANNAMRSQYLGPEWDDIRQRCVKFNTGDMTAAAIRHGAGTFGHITGAHITPIDCDSPYIGGLDTCEKTNRLGFSWGISVDKNGNRFIDEGAYWNIQTYVEVGRALLHLQDQVAYQIFDADGMAVCEPNYQRQKTFYKGNDLEKLAVQAGLNSKQVIQTVTEFNNSVKSNKKPYKPAELDGQSSQDLYPPKSNWALPVEKPPFYIYPVVPGVTFSFGGLNSNIKSEILDSNNNKLPGLYGCGEVTGGYFYYAYPTGSGLIKGGVTGREAGKNAAIYSRKPH